MTYQIKDRNSLNATWIKVCYSNRLHVCKYHRNTCMAKRRHECRTVLSPFSFLTCKYILRGLYTILKILHVCECKLDQSVCGCLSSSKTSLIEKCKCSVFRGIRISFELLKTVGAKQMPHIIWTKGAYYL